MSLQNTHTTIRSKPSNNRCILVAIFPISPKYHHKGHGKTTTTKLQQIHNWQVINVSFEHSFPSLQALFTPEKLMLCADSQIRQCYPVICTWLANCFTNNYMHLIMQPYWPVWESPKTSFGKGKSLSWQLRDYQLYFQWMILTTQGDEMGKWEENQFLED